VLAVGNRDDLAGSVLVGLGSSDVQKEAAGLGFDVSQIEGGELRATHRRLKFVAGAVCWSRTSRTHVTRHPGLMSPDNIPD
jgi:hypothetical protein